MSKAKPANQIDEFYIVRGKYNRAFRPLLTLGHHLWTKKMVDRVAALSHQLDLAVERLDFDQYKRLFGRERKVKVEVLSEVGKNGAPV